MTTSKTFIRSPFNALVIVASLGYMVDIYDMILYNVIKKESLEALGLAGSAYESNEIFLFNCQMIGMLLGGLLWGILGDKRGRISVLLGSILLYSVANIVNAFVVSLPQYAWVRFLAGIGLAGELGAGITLVVETMEKRTRGYGTMLVVTFGALGGVLAAIMGKKGGVVSEWFHAWTGIQLAGWQMAYLVGGSMGLMLLALRVGIHESGMYRHLQHSAVSRGDFLNLLRTPRTLLRYVRCICVGLPIWFMFAILFSLSVSITPESGVRGLEISSVFLYTYLGFTAGDFLTGLLSQLLGSRRKVILFSMSIGIIMVLYYAFPLSTDPRMFYWVFFFMGLFSGYWTLFITMAAEHFGTNIRSTVTTTVPNVVRGASVLMTLGYKSLLPFLQSYTSMPKVMSALVIGTVSYALAYWGVITTTETFNKDLDYLED